MAKDKKGYGRRFVTSFTVNVYCMTDGGVDKCRQAFFESHVADIAVGFARQFIGAHPDLAGCYLVDANEDDPSARCDTCNAAVSTSEPVELLAS